MRVLNFKPTGHVFGERSLGEMRGVHPELIAVAWLALSLSPVDFGFYDGLRTRKQQEEYLAAGSSWSENSYHLTGDAMDLVPWVDGKYTWAWEPLAVVVHAVQVAGIALGVGLVSGFAWDRPLARLVGDELIAERDAYIRRRTRVGREAHPDGAHVQRARRSASAIAA